MQSRFLQLFLCWQAYGISAEKTESKNKVCTAIGGVIVDGGKFDWKASGSYPWISEANPSYHGVSFSDAVGAAAFVTYIRAVILRDTGATLSPFHAFIFLQGLETLSLRVERHVSNALKIVEYLAAHPQVEAVHHPSLAGEPSHELYKKYLPNGSEVY